MPPPPSRPWLLLPPLGALLGVFAASCVPGAADAGPGPSGSFSFLTYNVAGLPEGLNDDQFPEEHIPLISPLLNAYDLVLVQEDFAYTRELRADLEHPYQSYPLEHTERFVNDGLNRFSRLAFDLDVTRVRWVACFGTTDHASDCLANKGFSVARHELAEGIELTVVNLHAEAGGGPEDIAAREQGIEQLIAWIDEHHAGEALLVAGDTNLHGFDEDDEPLIERLLEGLAVDDACRSLACGDERIDRVFFRSGTSAAGDPLEVAVTEWAVAGEFVDGEGLDLSDHLAVRVQVEWAAGGEAGQ